MGLVLKVSHVKNNIFDKSHTENRIKHIISSVNLDESDRKCKIVLVHGDMKEDEIVALYHHPKIKCMVSTTHGEGFGLPLFEFAQVGKPIIATEWSGHLDFLSRKNDKGKNVNGFMPVSYDLSPVQKNAVWKGVIEPDAMWAYPHEGSFKHRVRQVRKNDKWFERAKKHADYVLSEFAEEKIYSELCDLVFDQQNVFTENEDEIVL